MRTIFDMLSDAYTKYYSPTERLEVDKIIVPFKDMVVFQQYIPKIHESLGIKIYKLYDYKGYMYDRVYLGKGRT
jgi:hypothetical protein